MALTWPKRRAAAPQTLFCGDQTSQHLCVLRHLRDRLPDDKVISDTFPSSALDFPSSDVLRFGHPYVEWTTSPHTAHQKRTCRTRWTWGCRKKR